MTKHRHHYLASILIVLFLSPSSRCQSPQEPTAADDTLALEIVDEMVKAANKDHAGTDNGNVGFDVELFATLASKDENRTKQTAGMLQDRLQRIVALAAVYKWKGREFAKNSR